MAFRSSTSEGLIILASALFVFFVSYLAGLGFGQMTDLSTQGWQGITIAVSLFMWSMLLHDSYATWVNCSETPKLSKARKNRHITFALAAALLLPIAISVLSEHGQATNKLLVGLYHYRFWPLLLFYSAIAYWSVQYLWPSLRPWLVGFRYMFDPANWGQ